MMVTVLGEQDEEQNYYFHRHLQGIRPNLPEVVMRECTDATEVFSWRFTANGTNFFKEYYDCQCSGDIKSKFIMTCSIDNYCFVKKENNSDEKEESGVNSSEQEEECISVSRTYSFTVSQPVGDDGTISSSSSYGLIDSIEWGTYCVEYISDNGPATGPLCQHVTDVCAATILKNHGFTTIKSLEICNSPVYCQTNLTSLGYSTERAFKLCPSASLNGKACKSSAALQSECSDNEEENYMQTADCSNVEPCATSSCRQMVNVARGYTLEDGLARNLAYYPQCPSSSAGVTSSGTSTTTTRSLIQFIITVNLLYFISLTYF